MIPQEINECNIASVVLKEISMLVLLLFLTIPITFMQIQNHSLNSIENLVLILFIFTSLILGFKSWHLHFDALLLKNLAKGKFDTLDIDNAIYRVFGKKIEHKNLNDRIQACYKQISSYCICLILHTFLFVGINLWLLIHL
ncbi:MAG: hypothetical protein RSD71_03800 [Flavobacterium sp.]